MSADARDRTGYAIACAGLVVLALFVLVPLLADRASAGSRRSARCDRDPFGFPLHPRWGNYGGILAGGRYWRLLGNSLLIASVVTAITVVLAAMAAFVLAHLHFFGREMLASYLMLGLMFPATTAILPLFIQVRDLGLLDTYAGLILAEVRLRGSA